MTLSEAAPDVSADGCQDTGRLTAFLGASPQVTELLRQAQAAARGGSHPIVISGPMGAGKTHLARFIHQQSPRAQRHLEIIDCGALPELENSLFGHRRGAFTHAERDLGGRLQRAGGGTAVLDDFERLSLRQQDQLHRVVEDGTFYPLGAERPVRIDTRFIATTNKAVVEEVEHGRLKPDFVSRLSYFELRVVPLAERLADIPQLCRHLLQRNLLKLRLAGHRGDDELAFDEDCWPAIQARRFDDNVRGLEKLVVRLISQVGMRTLITPADIEAVHPGLPRERVPWFEQPQTLRTVREAAERDYILAVCRHADFHIQRVARVLDVTPKCVYAKLKQYGIARP
jgi:DNA-binding NtrC family response regulator